MPRKPRWEFRVLLSGKPVLGIMVKEIGSGLIVKPTDRDADVHLHVYPKDGELHRLVTHERFPQGDRRRHAQKRAVTMEELIYPFLEAIAPDDDPPPPLTSFADLDEFNRLAWWFGRILPRVFRAPDDRTVHVLIGPLGALLERAVSGVATTDWELDLTSHLVHEMRGGSDEELFVTCQEVDLPRMGKWVAFSADYTKMIVFVKGNVSVPKDLVMELSCDALQRASDVLMEVLGYEGYLRTLRRRGFLRAVKERALQAATGEAMPP